MSAASASAIGISSSVEPEDVHLALRGSGQGVFVGQAVLDRHGVVGQVVSVGQWTAEIVLITDADHALPVVVNRSGLRTIAVGTGDQGTRFRSGFGYGF